MNHPAEEATCIFFDYQSVPPGLLRAVESSKEVAGSRLYTCWANGVHVESMQASIDFPSVNKDLNQESQARDAGEKSIDSSSH